MSQFFELVDLARELAFARASGTHEKDRRTVTQSDLLNFVNHAFEGGVAGLDTIFEEARAFGARLGKARCDAVVTREVEIDDAPRPHWLRRTPWRLRLEQPAGQVARLGQPEEAYLRDVRPGRHVDQTILIVGIERKAAREVEKLSINFFEVPGKP